MKFILAFLIMAVGLAVIIFVPYWIGNKAIGKPFNSKEIFENWSLGLFILFISTVAIYLLIVIYLELVKII